MTLTFDDSNEEWRYARLSQVAQIMSIVDPELHNGILNLHDHEGCLTVTWSNSQVATQDNKYTLKGIWELLNEYSIEHQILK